MVGDGEQQKVEFYRQHRWPSGRCHQRQAARLPPLSPHVPILEHVSLFAREQARPTLEGTGAAWGPRAWRVTSVTVTASDVHSSKML